MKYDLDPADPTDQGSICPKRSRSQKMISDLSEVCDISTCVQYVYMLLVGRGAPNVSRYGRHAFVPRRADGWMDGFMD